MNRIIIIGNGFDLANGLKTSYDDFFFWLIKKELLNNVDNGSIDVESIGFKDIQTEFFQLRFYILKKNVEEFKKKVQNKKSLRELVDSAIIDFISESKDFLPITNPRIQTYILAKEKGLTVQIKLNGNSFFKGYQNKNRWTDLESIYFSMILDRLRNYKQNLTKHLFNNDDNLGTLQNTIRQINSSFEKLKKQFNLFIQDVETQIPKEIRNLKTLNKNVWDRLNAHLENAAIENTAIVNFNYTSLVSKYTTMMESFPCKLFPIHGSVNSSNEIIFGYGDDSHKEYFDLEQLDIDEALINIKSFHYPKNRYYRDLINFSESADYDVIVIGHSLGLSDRVLLKTLLDNERCKNIRIFHRGEPSYFNKLIALSRHFEDKPAMRTKIVEYDEYDKM